MHGEEKQLGALLKFEAELDASFLLRVLLYRLEVSHDIFLELLVSVLLINCKMSNFLLIFDELATKDNTDLFLVIGDLHVQYLDFGFLCLLRNRPLLLGLERYLIVYTQSSSLCHHISIHGGKIDSNCTLLILSRQSYFEVMVVLPGIDLESWLVSFVSNTVSYSGAEHHLGALHEVEHHVFKSGFECLFVDQVEVDLVISRNLDPNIAADKIDLATHLLKLVILGPVAGFFVDLEKQDRAR